MSHRNQIGRRPCQLGVLGAEGSGPARYQANPKQRPAFSQAGGLQFPDGGGQRVPVLRPRRAGPLAVQVLEIRGTAFRIGAEPMVAPFYAPGWRRVCGKSGGSAR